MASWWLTILFLGVAWSDVDKERVLKELNDIRFHMKSTDYIIYNSRSDDQDNVDSRLWGGVVLKKASADIAHHLRDLANDELGVTSLQGVFDSSEYVNEVQDLHGVAAQIANKLEQKLNSYRQIVVSNRVLVQSLYALHKRAVISQNLSCCFLDPSLFSLPSGDERGANISTSMHTVCDLLPYHFNKLAFNPGRNLTGKFSQNVQKYPAVKWQYFISVDGIHNEFPAHSFTSTSQAQCAHTQAYRHREVFLDTLSPQPKNVVVVVDISSDPSQNQLMTARELAKQLLTSLSISDKVGLLILTDTIYSPPSLCAGHNLTSATMVVKYTLTRYVEEAHSSVSRANHTLGMQTAFSLLPRGEAGHIVYISQGSISTLAEPKNVLRVMSERNVRHGGRVVIHSYGLMDGGDMPLFQKTFLKDLAVQNFTKYEVMYSGTATAPGTFQSVGSVEDVSTALYHLFVPPTTESPSASTISEPYNDMIDGELVVSVTSPCTSYEEGNAVIGVVGVDVTLEDLTEQLTHANIEGGYAFLINCEGYVLMHPSIERSLLEHDRPSRVHLSHFESLPGFESIARQILSSSNGTAYLEVYNRSLSGEVVASPYSITYTYAWYKVQTTPYIVVTRGHMGSRPIHKMSGVEGGEGMIYHRLDLGQLPPDQTCLHFQQLASFSTSAFFLSTRAFEKPYSHVSQPETRKMVANYLAYITDSTTYISTPGLKEGVKNEVIAISHVNKHWLGRWKNSPYSQFIVRRYVATPGGIYRMFPATLTRKLYDPTRTHWYQRALRLPGRIVLTKPHIDTAGSGVTVTLSHSIYEGRSAALHTPRDPIAAVMGADFPTSYFQRLLLQVIPTCELPSLRCFIMDDEGYIITYSNITGSTGYQSTLEKQHITHLEPLVANDILGHKSLVKKRQCSSFADRTVQRYYQFNTSHTKTLTNLKTGEQCVRYQMSLIPGTNAFVVMVNVTCEQKISAFCPCSITDRRCMNCRRMEQVECECPCECPLNTDVCTNDIHLDQKIYPVCELTTDSNVLFKLPKTISSRLAECIKPQCDKHTDERSCLGVVGCSWCKLNVDGVTELNKEYCAVQRACYGGVLGARTPYDDQIQPQSGAVLHPLLKNTPVGPVTGAILGAILVIVLGVYCYRHSIRRQPLAGAAGNDLYNSCYNQEVDGHIYHELPAVPGPSASVQAALLNAVDLDPPAARISPYRVNENYQPPRPVVTTTESSDHGYSTMTAHEEAESNSSTSCKESVQSTNQAKGGISLAAIKIPPPPSKNRAMSRLKMDERECRKLLTADNVCLPQTIDEQPELQQPLDVVL